jgi:hypothetical protein
VTSSQVGSGQRLIESQARTQQAFGAVGRRILENVQEPLARLLDSLADWTDKNQTWVAGWFTSKVEAFVTWVRSLNLSGFITWLKQVGETLNSVAQKIGGWGTVGDAAVALWIGGKVAASVSPIVALMGASPGGLLAVVAALGAILVAYKAVAKPEEGNKTPEGSKEIPGNPPAPVPAGAPQALPGATAAYPAGTITRDQNNMMPGPPLSLPLETVEGPVSMGRPLPVKITLFPQEEEDTFGGLFGKLFGKAGALLQRAWRGGAGIPYTGPQGPPSTKGLDPALLTKITAKAGQWGIDPDIAVRVWKSEGGASTMNFMQPGDNNMSFGPYQLYLGGGVGNAYEKATGHSVRDPSHMDDYLDFTFKWVRDHGWADWHGASRVGIYGYTGVLSHYDPRPHDVPKTFAPVLPTPEPGPAPPASGAAIPPGYSAHIGKVGGHDYYPPPQPWTPVPKPAADGAAAAAKSSMLIKRSEFNVARLQVHSNSSTPAGVAKDIRVALQRELEMNLAVT